MKTIWKTQLRFTDNETVIVPKGAEFLKADMQFGVLCVWYTCDPASEEKEEHVIAVRGTGHKVDFEVEKHLGTFMLSEGSLVFHAFLVKK